MRLRLKKKWLDCLGNLGGTVITDFKWEHAERWIALNSSYLNKEDFDLILTIVAKDQNSESLKQLQKQFLTLTQLLDSSEKIKIQSLDSVVDILKTYLEKTSHRWLFKQQVDGELVPYFLVEAVYSEAKKEIPADVTLQLVARIRYSLDRILICIRSDDLGKTIDEILNDRGLYRETLELVSEYERACAQCRSVASITGSQYYATGMMFEPGLVRNENVSGYSDVPVRVIVDDLNGDECKVEFKTVSASTAFWGYSGSKLSKSITCPAHPYLLVFYPVRHKHAMVHIGKLSSYGYNLNVFDKLILPERDKEMMEVLLSGPSLPMEDIVPGKSGGTIILCTGPSGTGKTLTAECFSERLERPLYAVQCSQLGTDAQELEVQLRKVLDRAERWNAVLLLDEADVYVQQRGMDMKQNAVVGVWLTMLERYKGVLFMTSNRGTIIDDAILSRATAWIHYTYPDAERAVRIWKVILAQYELEFESDEQQVLRYLNEIPEISGRTIKHLCKLAKLYCAQMKVPLTRQVFERVERYLNVSSQKDKII